MLPTFNAVQLAAIAFVAILFAAGLVYVGRYGLPGEDTRLGRITRRAARLTASLATPMEAESRQGVELLLSQAGYRQEGATYLFALVRASMAIILPFGALTLAGTPGVLVTAPLVAGGIAIGFYLPQMWVQRARRMRISAIRESLPQMMEYTLPLLEAGHTVDGTLRQLGPSLASFAPELAQEIARTTRLIDAGVPREEALDDVEELSGVGELESILRLMARAERSGASLLDTMRQTASDARQQQLRRTEAAMAANRPVMAVVAVLFNLPLLIVLLIGPAMIDAMTEVSNQAQASESR